MVVDVIGNKLWWEEPNILFACVNDIAVVQFLSSVLLTLKKLKNNVNVHPT